MKITGNESNDQICKEIGLRIRAFRMKKGLTQEMLAKDADISLRTLNNIEHGIPTSLNIVINVLRKLDLLGSFDSIIPEYTINTDILNKHRVKIKKLT